jgi:hypothetical protein
MRLVLALVMAALLTAMADAQTPIPKRLQSNTPPETELQKKQKRDAEKAYKSTIQGMPDKKYDPWAKVR